MINKYEDLTDEELITLLRDGDALVTDILLEKYKNLVMKYVGTIFMLGADRDDLIQEGMIGLYKAIRDYDSGRDASFFTFAELCISRQMYTAAKNSGRKKHAPLNGYLSIYAGESSSDGDETQQIISHLEAKGSDPEKLIIDNENVMEVWQIIDEMASPLEKSAFELYIVGMSSSQIARVLDRDQKSTDNALARIKSKLRARLGEAK